MSTGRLSVMHARCGSGREQTALISAAITSIEQEKQKPEEKLILRWRKIIIISN